MFWIGLIVGIILGAVAFGSIGWWFTTRVLCNSPEEFEGVYNVMVDATQNRESEIQVIHDGEVLNRVVFKDNE